MSDIETTASPTKKYKILDWVQQHKDKLNMESISLKSKAVLFLEENPEMIDWEYISYNTGAMHIIKKNLHRINWDILSGNKGAIDILKEHPDKINWNKLCSIRTNEAYELLKDNTDKITDWNNLCKNSSDWINDLLDGNIDKLNRHDIRDLSRNPNAIPTIEKYLDKMNWESISGNTEAFHLLLAHPEKIVLNTLQDNEHPDVIKLYDKYDPGGCLSNYDVAELSHMVEYLRKHPNAMSSYICGNENPEALDLMKEYVLRTGDCDIQLLSFNPIAIDFLFEHFENDVDWFCFCQQNNDKAIKIIEKNIDKVVWDILSSNDKAIHILEKNIDKLNWVGISENDGIYEEIDC